MKLYSPRQAALELHVSRAYVYHLIGLRKLKVQKLDTHYYVPESEVRRYKEGRISTP